MQSFGVAVQTHDPLAAAQHAHHEYGVTLAAIDQLVPGDAVVLAVPHDSYLATGWPLISRLLKNGRGVVMDVKARLPRAGKPEGVELWRM